MASTAPSVQRTYLLLTLLSTLAASFIWGINTLFLLDAGLSNVEAFTANAFFTGGEVLFEVPTGVVADIWGRRLSYLLGAATLLLSTLLYLALWKAHAPLWAWAIASLLLGLGFTFFSGATEAWLVDALEFTGHRARLDEVLAQGQVVTGSGMLIGAVSGGYLAQFTNLGVPYVVRSALLGLTFVVAALAMHDLGFVPTKSRGAMRELASVVRSSIDHGWSIPTVRWLMLAGLASGGIGMYAFYAAQPYLLRLYGNDHAFGIAGVAAAIVAGAQIVSGLASSRLRWLFARRTHVLLFSSIASSLCLWALGSISSFVPAIAILLVWSFSFWVAMPARQTLLNAEIPSAQRATVLSFDNLMTSAGGVVMQPALGRAADVWGYAFAYLLCAAVQLTSLPFLFLARRSDAAADPIQVEPTPVE